MNWEKFFKEETLDEGYDAFCYGHVKALKYDEKSIKAAVGETEEYSVEIAVEDGVVAEMNCTCPLAKAGVNCKHMAAVLYEWTEVSGVDKLDTRSEYSENSGLPAASKKISEDKAAALIGDAGERQIRTFLADILSEDERMYLRFKAVVTPRFSKEDVERYQHLIDETVAGYFEKEGLISYYKVHDFIMAMDAFLDKDVRTMIKARSYWNAFEVSAYLFVKVCDLNIEDPDDWAILFVNKCTEVWRKIAEEADRVTKEAVYEWVTANVDKELLAELPAAARIVQMYEEEKLIDQMMKENRTGRNWRF